MEKKKEELERKRDKMKTIYKEKFEDIRACNDTADEIAKEWARRAKLLAEDYSRIDPEFLIRIDGRDVGEKARAACYTKMLAAELKVHHRLTNKYTDWMDEVTVDRNTSAMIMKEKDRKLSPLVKFAFKCRHDKLRTAEHQWNRVKQVKNKESAPDWMKKIMSYCKSNKCPFGCDAVENLEHLVSCPSGNEVLSKLELELETLGFAYIKEWLRPSPGSEWKPKWTWMGIFPKMLIEVMEYYLEQQNKADQLHQSLQKVQVLLISGLRNLWINRCKKLFAKTDAEKERERVLQRTKRRKTSSSKAAEKSPRNPSTNSKVARVRAQLAAKKKTVAGKRKRTSKGRERSPPTKKRSTTPRPSRSRPALPRKPNLGLDGRYWTTSAAPMPASRRNDFDYSYDADDVDDAEAAEGPAETESDSEVYKDQEEGGSGDDRDDRFDIRSHWNVSTRASSSHTSLSLTRDGPLGGHRSEGEASRKRKGALSSDSVRPDSDPRVKKRPEYTRDASESEDEVLESGVSGQLPYGT